MIFDNGVYREMTQGEIDEIKAQNQKELLENATKYNLTTEDIIMILAQNINIILPNNESKPITEVVNTTIDLPFKVGYKWVLNGTTFALVEDADAIGTIDNPIIYTDDVPLYDNAFYIVNGVRNVYMNGQFVEF